MQRPVSGVISPNVEIYPGRQSYVAALNTAPGLAAGVHATTLQVRLCEDDPALCRAPVSGSPWSLPLKVTVKSKAEGAKRVQVSGPIDLVTHQGEPPIYFTLDARIVSELGRHANIAVIGLPNIATTERVDHELGSRAYAAYMQTAAGLAVGSYAGNVEVRMCMDSASVCRQPMAGSPWLVPVKLTVKSNSNLTPLVVPALPRAWATYQGNAAHTGYVPGRFDVQNFSRRWRRTGGDWSVNNLSLAHANGLVFNVNSGVYRASYVEAISEQTGAQVWRFDLSGQRLVDPPAVGDGKLYVTTRSEENQSFLWVIDQHCGALIARHVTWTDASPSRAPTVFKGDVYIADGRSGGMTKFINGQSQAWFDYLPSGHWWSPAIDANYAYAYLDGTLFAKRTDTGATAFAIASADIPYLQDDVSPVLSDKQMAYVFDNQRLLAFDLKAKTRAWVLGPNMYTPPALGNDTLYIVNLQETKVVLESRSAATGALLASSEALADASGGMLPRRVIVTDNIAFVGSDTDTFALDLATGKIVWRHPLGGDLSISDRGVLYIQNSFGYTDAVNLR